MRRKKYTSVMTERTERRNDAAAQWLKRNHGGDFDRLDFRGGPGSFLSAARAKLHSKGTKKQRKRDRNLGRYLRDAGKIAAETKRRQEGTFGAASEVRHIEPATIGGQHARKDVEG